MLNSSQIEQFHKDGFLVVPSVLTNEQVAELRSFLVNLFDEVGVQFEGDTQNLRFDICARYPELSWLLCHPPIVAAIKSLLGNDFVYLPEMAAHDSRFGAVGGWHKDTESQERAGYLFHEQTDYLMVEAALYLQDNSEEYGGGLDVLMGSHLRPGKYLERTLWQRVKSKVQRGQRVLLQRKEEGEYSIPSKAGDLVLFNFKVDHRGTPPAKPVTPERRKLAIFIGCSANNEHIDSYTQFLLSRADYKYLKNHKYPEFLHKLAKEHNIKL